MKKCQYCGADLPDDAKACSTCGRPVAGMQDADETSADSRTDKGSASEDSNMGSGRGYWQYGRWHPVEDLNRAQADGGNGQDQNQWNSGSENGSSSDQRYNGSSGNGQNQWNGQPSGWGNQSGWNGQNPSGGPSGWENQNQNQWNNQGQWGNQWNNGYNGDPGQNQWNGQNSGWGNQNNGWNGQPGGAKTNTLSVISMVFGILSLLFGFFYLIPCIAGVVTGIIALVQIHRNPGQFDSRFKGFAIAGIVTGGIALVLWGFIFAITFQMLSDPEMLKQILQEYMNEGGSGSSAIR